MGQHIGFIGLGMMGGVMAPRLLEAGHTLIVYDLNPAAVEKLVAKGAKAATSPKDVGDSAELVIASLPTPPVVKGVAETLAGCAKVKTFIDLSTTGPKVAAEMHKILGDKGIASLDAPVSGGIAGAAAGKLAIMVSGDEAAFEANRAVLEVFGKLFYLGDTPGAGQTMKLVNNLLAAAQGAITAEGMAMGIKAGLNPRTMIEVLNASSGRSSATMDKWPKAVLPRTFDFGFQIGLQYKDVRLCLDEAEAMGVPMVVGAAVRQMLAICNQEYGPQADMTIIAKLIEGWAKIDPQPS